MPVRNLLGKTEGLEETLSNPRMAVIDISADDDDVHDGKELCLLVVTNLLFAIVSKQAFYLLVALRKRGRRSRADQGLYFTVFKHPAQDFPWRGRGDPDRCRQRRVKSSPRGPVVPDHP